MFDPFGKFFGTQSHRSVMSKLMSRGFEAQRTYQLDWQIRQLLHQVGVDDKTILMKKNRQHAMIYSGNTDLLVRVGTSLLGNKLVENHVNTIRHFHINSPEIKDRGSINDIYYSIEQFVPFDDVDLHNSKLQAKLMNQADVQLKPLYANKKTFDSKEAHLDEYRLFFIGSDAPFIMMMERLSEYVTNRCDYQHYELSKIHGDLTHENMLIQGENLWLTDFTWSMWGHSLFDTWQFQLFWAAKKNRVLNELALFSTALDSTMRYTIFTKRHTKSEFGYLRLFYLYRLALMLGVNMQQKQLVALEKLFLTNIGKI